MEATKTPHIEAKLQTMVTAEGVRHWCQELYVDHTLIDVSPWTASVADAIRAGAELRERARSDWAYREARAEAHALFA